MTKRPINVRWQQNYLKTPDFIVAKIQNLPTDDVIVECVKRIPCLEIQAGNYEHLGIRLNDGKLHFPERLMPDRGVGRYCRTNFDGKVVVRKDPPKVKKTIWWEAPNWKGSGTHSCSRDRDVYQKEFISPKGLEIELLEDVQIPERQFLFKFRVDEVLDRRDTNFDRDLLYNVNVLQENTGVADVFSSATTRADYLETVQVDWQILPPGDADSIVDLIMSGRTDPSGTNRPRLKARLEPLETLHPEAIIHGTGGFSRYFGAKFSDCLVAFENLEYGNAIHIMFDDWQELSKRSRLELLGTRPDGFKRILHRQGWEDKLVREIQIHRCI